MKKYRQALIELNVAGILFGFTAQFSYLIALPADSITFWRSLFALAAVGAFMRLNRQPWKIASIKDGLVMVVIGALLALHWVTYFHAMQVAGVVVGLIALFTFPIITVIFEPLVFRHKLAPLDLLIAAYVFIGIWLVVPEFSATNQIAVGVFWGVVSAFLYTFRVLLQKKYVQHYPSAELMFYQLIVVIALLGVCFPIVVPKDAHSWQLIALLGAIFTAIPHVLTVRSLSYLKAKTVAIISCMQPLYGAILAVLIAHEHPRIQTVIGGCIVLSAALIESIRARDIAKQLGERS